jgi:hypothetical protein
MSEQENKIIRLLLNEMAFEGAIKHLFSAMPSTPTEALSRSGGSDIALFGKFEAIDSGAGSVEMNADWFIDDPSRPKLKATVLPFRPTLTPGKQQVRAQVVRSLNTRFDYLFDSGRGNWSPQLGQSELRDDEADTVWTAVSGLRESEFGDPEKMAMLTNLREASPESGSFVLFSRRRRKLGARV